MNKPRCRLAISVDSQLEQLLLLSDLGGVDVNGGHLGRAGIHHKFLATICLLSSKNF